MQEKKKRSWGFRIGIAFAMICIALMLFSLSLQLIVVQNFTADQITKWLSKKTQTRVEIDHVSFSIFDQFLLNGFIVEDEKGDTLLYSERLAVNFESRLWGLLRKDLKVESLSIENTQLNIRRDTGAYLSNLQILLNRLKNEKQDTVAAAPIGIRFNIKELKLDQVLFSQVDSVNGSSLKAYVKSGRLRVDEIDLEQQYFNILRAELRNSEIDIQNFTPHPLPKVVEVVNPITDEVMPADSLDILKIHVDQFKFRDGRLTFDNFRKGPKSKPSNILDYDHLQLYDIDAEINRFDYAKKEFTGSLDFINFSELSGFELYNLSARTAKVNPKELQLIGVQLKTPNSLIGDTLQFSYDQYADFKNFDEKVRMRLVLDDADVRLQDIMTFAAGLNNNAFFKTNRNRDVNISGLIEGTINNLKAEDLVLQINGKTRLEGSLSMDNPSSPERVIFLYLDRLQTNMETLRKVIPNFSLPPNFDRLGNIQYEGQISQVFSDFLIEGNLNTNLGQVDSINIQFQDVSKGFEYADYRGSLSLKEFDLGTWTENPDFGKITVNANVKNGKGLTSETTDAMLDAQVNNFTFRKYRYEDANFSGHLTPRLFEGQLSLEDKNLAFDFSGKLDYRAAIPQFDFGLDLRRLKPKALNLMQKDWTISGDLQIDMSIEDNDLTHSQGVAKLNNLHLSDNLYSHQIDSMLVTSEYKDTSGRNINITSELLDLHLEGHYELINLWSSIGNYTHRNFPTYAQKLAFPKTSERVDTNEVEYNLFIHDTGDLTRLLDPKLDTVKELLSEGYYSSSEQKLDGLIYLPKLTYDSLSFERINLTSNLLNNKGSAYLEVRNSILKNGMTFDSVELAMEISQNEIDYLFDYKPVQDKQYRTKIGGKLSPYDSSLLQLHVDNYRLNLFNEKWSISPENYILFDKDEIYTNEFTLRDNGIRAIDLSAYGKKGVKLNLENFSFGIIDSLWDYKPLDFSGEFDANVRVLDIFNLEMIQAEVKSDSLMINGDHWGNLDVVTNAANLKSTFFNLLTLTKEDSRLSFKAQYNPSKFDQQFVTRSTKSERKNYLHADLETDNFPLAFLQYFILGASDFEGKLDANLQLRGEPKKLDVAGDALAKKCGVTVDFLKTRYFVDNQSAKINNRLIDATNAVITDEEGNQARLRGGITHNRLKNLGLNVQLITDRFIAMNTTEKDNEVFYGKAVGGGVVEFEGSFNRTNIVVNATADEGTKITIPVTSNRDAPEISFIKFKDKNENIQDTIKINPEEVEGVDLDLFLTLTEVAEVELVFDERAGDILKGQGRGDLQIYLDRTGEMAMYGNYNVERGDYLFTLLNFVNKPFVVRRGGTIAWRGDPFNAQIDIDAEYKDLSTPVANLIPEYLIYANEDTKQRAARSTNVDLVMHLKGELYQPSINFELAFPNLQGDLRNYTDNKLRTLRQDQNELNKQVFGLIVLGQFLPSDFTLTGQSSGDFGINTVSEFIANQLSIIVTDILGDAIDDFKYISSFDLDLDYNRYDNQTNIDFGGDNFYLNGQEYYIRNKAGLFNEKVTFTFGGNLTNASAAQGSTQTTLGLDFILEVAVNEKRDLKLRVFYVREPGFVGGLDQQSGIGLSYEKEYDSFKDIFGSIFKKDEEKKNE
ncbi:MAG: translocation/assembly module TamB domain-containing protein [Bacteroidota bacterium]